MTEAKNSTEGKPGPKRSKSPQGGRFSPEPVMVPFNDETAPELFAQFENRTPLAEWMAEVVADQERAATEYLAVSDGAGEIDSRQWARKVLSAALFWKKSQAGEPAERERAAYELGRACMAFKMCADLVDDQRHASHHGTKGKRAKGNANMDDLRERMAKLPRARLKDAPTVRLALEAAGWVSPWTERVTEDRIREVLRDLK